MAKNKKPSMGKTSEAIQDEIRTRVMERYAEMQGVEMQQSELQATLDALHDITNVPRHEIEKIASEVQEKHTGSQKAEIVVPKKDFAFQETPNFIFDRLSRKAESGKRGFIHHLVPYVAVNSILVFLNLISTWFPWALFPLLGWGIGLTSHYFAAVHWPKKDLIKKIETVHNQIYQILFENWPRYRSKQESDIYNGIYRLIVTECSKEILEEYIENADDSLSPSEISRISTQLIALQQKYVPGKKSKKNPIKDYIADQIKDQVEYRKRKHKRRNRY
ncbi:MAG: 2TM domain-containing protein [Proteobacteria bacterium]|nr:2TM domain-containing protein [Pseudomonadota bacterium]